MDNLKTSMSALLDDAMLMLVHAHRSGKLIEDADRKAILEFREAHEKGAATPTQEGEFLSSVAVLTNLLKPATIEGIRNTDVATASAIDATSYFLNWLTFGWLCKSARGMPPAFRTSYHYGAIALVTLTLLVLALLITTNKIVLLQAIAKSQTQLEELSVAKKKLLGEIEDRSKAKSVLAANSPEYAELARETSELRDELAELEDRQGAALRAWNSNVTILERSSLIPGYKSVEGKSIDFEHRADLFSSVRLSLVTLLGFVTPALAAFLGAVAYSLRGISKEIVEDSFTEETRMQYRLRVTLAPLGGIAVGLITGSDLLPSDTTTFVRVVSDIAEDKVTEKLLAIQFSIGFVVGYSIEVLFSLADNFTAAFKRN